MVLSAVERAVKKRLANRVSGGCPVLCMLLRICFWGGACAVLLGSPGVAVHALRLATHVHHRSTNRLETWHNHTKKQLTTGAGGGDGAGAAAAGSNALGAGAAGGAGGDDEDDIMRE